MATTSNSGPNGLGGVRSVPHEPDESPGGATAILTAPVAYVLLGSLAFEPDVLGWFVLGFFVRRLVCAFRIGFGLAASTRGASRISK